MKTEKTFLGFFSRKGLQKTNASILSFFFGERKSKNETEEEKQKQIMKNEN